MSTIGSLILAFLYAYWLPPPPVTKALLLIAAILCFFIASYRVWLKEREARLKEQAEWQAKQAQFDTENVELKSQLEVEKANSNRPKIEGEIQEIHINETRRFGEAPGAYVTIKIVIISSRFLPIRIKSFSLKMSVKGKVYESENFFTSKLYIPHVNTEIKNLADMLSQSRGLEYKLEEEGFLRFYIPGLIPSTDSEGGVSEGTVFNLDDVEDVTLIVTDLSNVYTIVASGIKPQWADISTNWFM